MKIQGVEPSEFIKHGKTSERSRQSFKKTIESLQDAKEDKSRQSGMPSKEEIKDAVDQLNQTMEAYRTNLRFQMHEESEEWQVSVINARTDEVIRKIPPDKTLDMVAYMKEMLGLLVDEFV